MTLGFRSPAKINLFLHIHSKRPDGYHELSSLIQSVTLFDMVTLNHSQSDQFSCSEKSLENHDNLVIKARELFRKKSGLSDAVSIHLIKNIPTEAGLGGGSSNAATVLWGLNQLFRQPFSEAELQEMSAELGSDVPFFFSLGTAFCRGRGEIVQNIESLPLQYFNIYKPQTSLSTKDVFETLSIPDRSIQASETTLNHFLEGKVCYENDLELVAFQLKPELLWLKKELQSFYSHVLMSGAGSSFFCIGKKKGTLEMPRWSVCQVNRKVGEWY
ncbi:MAG: 4-diphosphocytidyl-2-C-methyl-D-erythritol kinase [Chlamydiae bacterium]|nr:4-diphosphocytidyl-2-C-methyl-D-erythritol kinase [Chlamydiota bacterium]